MRGSLTPLLTHLARANDLTDEDRLALRAIVEEPDPILETPQRSRSPGDSVTAATVPTIDNDHEYRAEVNRRWNHSCIPC